MQLLKWGLKPHSRKLIACMVALIMLFSMLGMGNPGTAQAKNDSSVPAENLIVNINNNGEIIPVHTYTIEEMQALSVSEAVYYSSIDSMPAPNITIAKGVALNTLVADINAKYSANITIGADTLKSIKLYGTDGWFSNYTYDYLFGANRYYYPRLVETWDKDKNVVGPGGSDNPVAVEPIFAVYSYQERFLTNLNHAMVGPSDEGSATFRFCFGQTADEISKNTVTNNKFGRWVNKIEITLNDGQEAPAPKYTVTPAENAIYTIGETSYGIKTMTVNAGQNGLKYFVVSVASLLSHEGREAVVFAHWRNGIELERNATVADFDVVNNAEVGFNVQAGDLIKVYVLDCLSNAIDSNPIILQ